MICKLRSPLWVLLLLPHPQHSPLTSWKEVRRVYTCGMYIHTYACQLLRSYRTNTTESLLGLAERKLRFQEPKKYTLNRKLLGGQARYSVRGLCSEASNESQPPPLRLHLPLDTACEVFPCQLYCKPKLRHGGSAQNANKSVVFLFGEMLKLAVRTMPRFQG